jgi:PepB aminopeptidase
MNVWLSREFAPAEWGEGALLSHRADGMVIHLVTANPLLDIQQAARRLCQQGIQKVTLAGHWEREQQWAFAQGLQTPKAEVQLQWAMSSEEDREELEARWLCGRWVREMTNATPEQLGPLELAVEAASFYYRAGAGQGESSHFERRSAATGGLGRPLSGGPRQCARTGIAGARLQPGA